MPVKDYFDGNGEQVMKDMKDRYGAEKGEEVFYATAKKKDQEPEDTSEKEAAMKEKTGAVTGVVTGAALTPTVLGAALGLALARKGKRLSGTMHGALMGTGAGAGAGLGGALGAGLGAAGGGAAGAVLGGSGLGLAQEVKERESPNVFDLGKEKRLEQARRGGRDLGALAGAGLGGAGGGLLGSLLGGYTGLRGSQSLSKKIREYTGTDPFAREDKTEEPKEKTASLLFQRGFMDAYRRA